MIVLSALLFAATLAGEAPAQDTPGLERPAPRLCVMISVDQMIPEQLERLQPFYSGGFARFNTAGRVYRAAKLRYSRTETGPGHASFGTGCLPRTHGIVANNFRDAEAGGWVYCAGDDDARPITRFGLEPDSKNYQVSPRNLLVPGAAGWFERNWPEGKSIAIAGKDRSAILTAGAGCDAVVWWDKYRCGFTSSDHYGDELPSWARNWNEGWRAHVDGFVWKPIVPLAELQRAGTAPDEREGEAALSSNGVTFPHPAPELSDDPGEKALKSMGGFVYKSALVDQVVLDLALQAVVAEDLGGDEHIDLLCLSLTGCDTVGHFTGPYSAETTDVLLRADRELGKLFDLLDERLGADGWVACLTADHGVLELPEARRARLEPGARLAEGTLDDARKTLRSALKERFGSKFSASIGGGGLYLDPQKLEKVADEHDAASIRSFARDFLVRENEWIAGGFTADELELEDFADGDPFFILARNSSHSTRGPDVALRVVPGMIIDRATGTTHGTPYVYDRRVPLAFLGPGFEAGERWGRAESIDALPTLLHALGAKVPAGAFDGRVID